MTVITKTEEQIIRDFVEFRAKNPLATRRVISDKIGVSTYRLEKMHDAGLLKLPPKISPSLSGKMGKKVSPWRTNLKLGKFSRAA